MPAECILLDSIHWRKGDVYRPKHYRLGNIWVFGRFVLDRLDDGHSACILDMEFANEHQNKDIRCLDFGNGSDRIYGYDRPNPLRQGPSQSRRLSLRNDRCRYL